MPEVEKHETREHYLARCVPMVMAEGLDNKAAVGKCEGMYDEHHKKHGAKLGKGEIAIYGDTGTEYRAALTLGSDFAHPKQKNGKPCHYYWKEALTLGDYLDHHGNPFSVTPQRIDTLIKSFKLAKEKTGFEPPAPESHKPSAGKNYGYVVDARKTPAGSLELLHQFIGDEEKNEALNKKTSIGTLADYTDAYGNHYEEIIDHNAVLPNPVLTHLEDFKPALAASKDQPVRAVVLTLARKEMADMAATPEQVDYVKRECYGGMNADHVDKDNAMDHLIAHHRALKSTHPNFGMRLGKDEAEKAFPVPEQLKMLRLSKEQVDAWKPQPPAPDPRLAELTGKLEKAEARVLELSKESKSLDPELLVERRLRLVQTRKDSLSLRLGKDSAEKLMDKLVGSETRPNGLMLSRDSDASDCRAAEVIDIIVSAPKTPDTGSQTRPQVLDRDAALQLSKEQQQQQQEPNILIERAKKSGITIKA